MNRILSTSKVLAIVTGFCLLFSAAVFAQETTAGLQGTVKDPSGAVVSNAHVVVTSDVLVGEKAVDSDSNGYYRFANLPPGTYTVTVTAKGFSTYKSSGLVLETGHLPSVDIALAVGTGSTVVEVNAASEAIDVTTNHTMTNVTEDVIKDVPHGRSFQSVIQFAPSARNEPLEGNNIGSNGTGGAPPGSTTNGQAYGFSVGGASDAENSYLVEGQETANLIGGYSHTNVPFDFIQEVQVKTNGIEAEHGGALGGVVNVIMKKGTNAYHGSLFGQFENDGMDGGPQQFHRYDPAGNLQSPGAVYTQGYADNATQFYQPKRYHSSDVFPGFTFGGPILKDRIFGFVGFNPEWNYSERNVTYGPDSGGCVALGLPACGLPGVPAAGATLPFSSNTHTYYTTGRVDGVVTQKIRVFGSWLYQYQRVNGVTLPYGDSTTGLTNVSAGSAPSSFAHSLGYTAPNQTINFGGDVTITPHVVATTRYGYYYENYHDFGYPTSNTLFLWQTPGCSGNPCTANSDWSGAALPTSLAQPGGSQSDPFSQFFTKQNKNKAIQFDQDLAYFKSGWMGTHNFKFGYQLNRLQNDISQTYSEPDVQLFVGQVSYGPVSTLGNTNCGTTFGASVPASAGGPACAGQFGYATVSDFGTGGDVTSYNHGLFAQDSWTVSHGLTLNLGIRFDKEYLPASTVSGLKTNPINFSWGDKIAPRIGAAWDVFRDGRMKVFGGYGKFFDIMKLNVAISSFGGQYWNDCVYALDTSNLASIVPALNSAGRFCQDGPAGSAPNSNPANWAGGTTPAGLTFIENVNNRTFPTTCSTCSASSTGVVPGLKPFSQHEADFGVDYQLAKTLSLEARYDRTRLDNAIEDSSIFSNNETFVVGNPGKGVESTFDGFYNFLYPNGPAQPNLPCSAATCVPQHLPAAARSYDGVELRLTKAPSGSHLAGMFSYTYSKYRGNYTGLTSSDISDGQQGGRSSPNNSRAFDEPYFQYNSFGGSSSGLLPTDRPNTFKGYGYYELSWLKKFSTDFGIFQYLYQGSPMTSYLDVGANSGGAWAVQAWDRGKWVDASQDPTTGVVSLSAPRTRRTPWYTQTDFSINQNFKLTETKGLSFSVNATNLLNQRAVTVFNTDITSLDLSAGGQYLTLPSSDPGSQLINPATNPPAQWCSRGTGSTEGAQCSIASSSFFYAAAMRPYNVQALLNDRRASCGLSSGCISTAVNSAYGKPYYYQLARTIRLTAKFTF
jgi:outer membrane receptor protein involved in Fe transport